MPDAKFKNTTRLVKWQRIVKSPREIECMRGAGKIVGAMHQRIADVLRPGVKQSDVVAEIYETAIRGVDGVWGNYPAAVPMIGAVPMRQHRTLPGATVPYGPAKASFSS